MKGAGKIPPFSVFITIYSMKLVLKEIDGGLTSVEAPVPNRYSAMGLEEDDCSCTCPQCHKPIEPDSDGEIEGDEIELSPQILAGILSGKTKLVVFEKKK